MRKVVENLSFLMGVIRNNSRLFVLFAVMIAGNALADIVGTNVWTGAANNGLWADAGNWKVVMNAGSEVAFADTYRNGMIYDLRGAEDSAEVTNNVSDKSVHISGVLVGENKAFNLVQGTNAKAFIFTPALCNSSSKVMEIVIPAGSTLNWGANNGIDWDGPARGKIKVIGGGMFRVTAGSFDQYNEGFVLSGGTRMILANNAINVTVSAIVIGDGASYVELEKNAFIAKITGGVAGSAGIKLSGNTLSLGDAKNWLFNGNIEGPGTIHHKSGVRNTINGEIGNDVKIIMEAGDIVNNSFGNGQGVNMKGNGTITLREGAATLSTLEGNGATGQIVLNGGDLTVSGSGTAESTVYGARIVGEGGIVKKGADYDLTLAGANSYTGDTKVEEGKLTIDSTTTYESKKTSRIDDLDNLVFYLPVESGKDWGASGIPGVGDAEIPTWPHKQLTEPTEIEGPPGAVGSAINLDGRIFELDERPIYDGGKIQAVECAQLRQVKKFKNPLPCGAEPFTASMWIKPTASNEQHKINSGELMFWGNWEAGPCQCRIMRNDKDFKTIVIGSVSDAGQNRLVLRMPDGSSFTGAWHHIVVSAYPDYEQNKSIVKMYVDGKLGSSAAVGLLNINLFRNEGGTRASEVQVGGVAPWGYYNGGIDDVRLYNIALTDEEVDELYRMTKPAEVLASEKVAMPDPVAHWAFDDPENPGKDSGPFGYHLTAVDDAKPPKLVGNAATQSGYVLSCSASSGPLTWKSSGEEGSPVSLAQHLPSGSDSFTTSIRYNNTNGDGKDIFSYGSMEGYWRFCIDYWPRRALFNFCNENWVWEHRVWNMGEERNAWVNLIAVCDGEKRKVRLYKDGVLVKTVYDPNPTFNIKAEELYVARNITSSTPKIWTDGQIDDIRIYNVALSEAQVRALAMTMAADKTSLEQVVPASSRVSVSKGAAMDVKGAQTLYSFDNAGDVTLYGYSQLTVGGGKISGRVCGGGTLSIAGDTTLDADVGEFRGKVRVAGGTLATSRDLASAAVEIGDFGRIEGKIAANVKMDDNLKIAGETTIASLVETSGKVELPTTAKITLSGSPQIGTWTLVDSGELAAPEDFSQWTIEPARFSPYVKVVDGKKLVLRIRGGLLISVR